ncbi:hypothetical protein NEOLEDRAFT_1121083 [Neolentinus lepideus HHB14362 ss-1]|uniref:BTB domain-containing protein n=1 Tax=Neolentinus lepideus HHB14362 ss-1 TaxID=1314782 RepID=A0A165PXB9_9AGAM|nr:hypothetical protein NEOLEDRAFT_1121083 [Neolentinus lepideus HHB14362 ss-1]
MSDPQPDSIPADAPFDRPDADVIIRSSDNVDFRMFKLMLSVASPVFAGMFTLPRAVEEASADKEGGLPVVRVTEDRKAVDILLRLCYPGTVPDLLTLDDVKKGLEVAMKYEVDSAMSFIRRALVSPEFLDNNALRVYAIACLHKLWKEAEVSAKASLRMPREALWDAVTVHVPELHSLPAEAYLHLVRYHRSFGSAAAPIVHRWSSEWIIYANRYSFCFFKCIDCTDSLSRLSHNINDGKSKAIWWSDFVTSVEESVKEHPLAPASMLALASNERHLEKPLRCSSCRKTVNRDIYEVIKIISSMLEESAEKAVLDLSF